MCECLCGAVRGEFNFRVKDTDPVVSIDIYRGCKYCEKMIGVDIRLFTKAGAQEWLYDATILDAEPNEYGGLPSLKSLPIVSIDALVAVSKAMPSIEEYESLADWLDDHGLDLLQSAMRLTQSQEDPS